MQSDVPPRLWRLLALMVAVIALGAATAPPSATAAVSPAAALREPPPVPALRAFDAVTTVKERNLWKHLALIGDQYAIFTDRGLVEGPAPIKKKWPFLPKQFTRGIDAAAIAFSGPKFRWRHTWTNGTQAIIFEDGGIVSGPFRIPIPYDGLTDVNGTDPKAAPIQHLGVRGGSATVLFSKTFEVPTLPFYGEALLPKRFRSDLDDISLEIEKNAPKFSYYKGNERIIFDDRRVIELVNLDVKWPFLNAWRSSAR
ncbi:hypothetical protein [Nonomuraea gerenzanensis]|uniref:Secreted protein n=1 Tax=Nonomuraea gerenzanensis TaxID=93944 RepID=A0A1M4EDE5_9ACTN|nr:hypothetical protein [Nonomuraea gerenzanensis]UBU08637.1 hypothetical protein LCN96_30085 [Nonomuraea gerenzanensis]SBO96997.1 hypothetical protein BN4615_P6513 [Nonomuraea gerenzanensis]